MEILLATIAISPCLARYRTIGLVIALARGAGGIAELPGKVDSRCIVAQYGNCCVFLLGDSVPPDVLYKTCCIRRYA